MDDGTLARWMNLVRAFELSKSGVEPWDAQLLEANFPGASHGEKCSIQFLLGVWGGCDAACGKFDVLDALSIW